MPSSSERKRAAHIDLTRSDGLPLALQRLLILACEDQGLSDKSPAEVVDSNPAFDDSGSEWRVRCRGKVRYFRQLREEAPDKYW